MNEVVDDDNIEFRGGTLQISSDPHLSPEISNHNISNLEPLQSKSTINIRKDQSIDGPAILSGADTLSTATSTCSGLDDSRQHNDHENTGAILPSYDIPFANEDIRNYFTNRNGIVENAIQECIATLIFPENDGECIGSWLLTEISLWDNEKERLLILTDRQLFTIKYDFIALRKLEFKKIPLSSLDTVVIGELVYPPASLVPRINGLANGVTSVVKEKLIDRWNKSEGTNNNAEYKFFDPKYFQPRERNMRGVRLMWNKGQPLPLSKMWNPFTQDIPFLTFTSHPVFWHKDAVEQAGRSTYDMESFSRSLISATEKVQPSCTVHHTPIVIENYIGVTSLLHNKTGLGFFKVRGKFSF